MSEQETPSLWWCLKCGIVWTAEEAPICRHNALDLPAAVMVPLPSYHPYYPADKETAR